MTYLLILPILIPLISSMLVLLLRGNRRVQAWFAVGAMALSLIVSGLLLWTVNRSGTIVFHSGGWFTDGVPVGITLVGDPLSALLKRAGHAFFLASPTQP